MNIRQLQVAYLPDQDRLLVRVSTGDRAEIRMWMTRRLLMRLTPALDRLLESVAITNRPAAVAVAPEARTMVAEFAREAALSSADFKTPFDDKPASLPMGDEPLLVTRIDMTPQPDGQTRIAFVQEPNKRIDMAMTEALLHAFCALIKKEAAKSDWFTPSQAGTPPASADATSSPAVANLLN